MLSLPVLPKFWRGDFSCVLLLLGESTILKRSRILVVLGGGFLILCS